MSEFAVPRRTGPRRTGDRARQSFDWTRRLGGGICRHTTSLLLGATLAAAVGLGTTAFVSGAIVGSAPDDAVLRRLSKNHLAVEAAQAYRQGQAAADMEGAHRMRPDPQADRRAANIAIRLAAFGFAGVGFCGAYRSSNRLKKWWNGDGKFPLAPKDKAALEFAGMILLMSSIGLVGVAALASSAGILVSNDALVVARAGLDPLTGTSLPAGSQRWDALVIFCIGIALSGGATAFFAWVFYKIATALRSLFRPPQSKGAAL